MRSSNGQNILEGFGICSQENFRHHESSEIQFGERNNFFILKMKIGQASPGFEPGSLGQEPTMLTFTLQSQVVHRGKQKLSVERVMCIF